jgi:hypothetical protein
MALERDNTVMQVTDSSYRCPGCGELVDSRRLDEVLTHHQHVLHPAPPEDWFQFLAESTRGAGTSPRQTHLPEERVRKTQRSSPQSWSRRYGHS